MQIVIPMTGYGSRFINAGYKDLKPLIKVRGKPMIEWIVKGMFPGEENFLFICRKEHLDSIPELERLLKQICPTGRIFSVDDWKKLGPVNEVLRAESWLSNDEPIVVNYCDFFMHWDWHNFKKEVLQGQFDGAVPCYTGFHPHLVPKENVYASCLRDEKKLLREIKEKFSFEADKTKAFHSPGTYYFKSKNVVQEYFRKSMNSTDAINGEYYVSLVYNHLVKDGLRVWIPDNVTSFCQWGTPEDLEDFLFWNQILDGWNK